MHSFYHPERRKNRRIRIDFPAICRVKMPSYWVRIFDEPAFEIATVDISEGGISILSDEYLTISSRVSLEFIASDLGLENNTCIAKHVDFNGRVVYNSFLKDQNLYRLGVSFDPLEEHNQGNLFKLICTPHPNRHGYREKSSGLPEGCLIPSMNWLMQVFHKLCG